MFNFSEPVLHSEHFDKVRRICKGDDFEQNNEADTNYFYGFT